MKERGSQGIIFKYTISGFIIGFLTVIFILVIDFFIKKISFSEIIDIHRNNPVYLVLDLSPLMLAFYAFVVSKKYSDASKTLHTSKLSKSH